jgi:hypothetical protein
MKIKSKILLALAASTLTAFAGDTLKAEKETRHLAFQIFTYGPNPIMPVMGEGKHPPACQVPGQGGAARLHRGHQAADRRRR